MVVMVAERLLTEISVICVFTRFLMPTAPMGGAWPLTGLDRVGTIMISRNGTITA